jgi:hypothetical protein
MSELLAFAAGFAGGITALVVVALVVLARMRRPRGGGPSGPDPYAKWLDLAGAGADADLGQYSVPSDSDGG